MRAGKNADSSSRGEFQSACFTISYVYRTVHHCDSWRIKTNLMSLAILFHFLWAQHVSDINISIIRSLRLFCWITTLVVLFLVRCVLEFRCGWVGVVSMLQAKASACNTDRALLSWYQIRGHEGPVCYSRCIGTVRARTQRKSIDSYVYWTLHPCDCWRIKDQLDVTCYVISLLMCSTCWAHKSCNKIASNIKFVFYSSTTLP